VNWSTAVPDWAERIVAGLPLVPGKPLFPTEAAAALDVFKALRIVDAPGRPTFGEAGESWVFDFVEAVFGAYDPERGERLINEFFLCVAKKNGKSTIAAGIMLTALIRNWRDSNELIIVAPTIKAADNSFKPAADMVRADPELNAAEDGFLHIQDHLRTITHLGTKATLRILAADTGTVAGNKAAFVLVDELWEFGSKKNADAMMREAAGGRVARPEGFLISITTQSDAPPAGVFKDKLDYARQVRDGEVEDKKFLPVIYEFPEPMVESEAYLNPENYFITNPYIGRTEWGRKWIEDELEKERAKGPETRNVFLAKHLNIEIGLNLRANRWPGADHWDEAADEELTGLDHFEALDRMLARSEVVVVGIDGGGLDDLFGLSILGREPKEIEVKVAINGVETVQRMKRWLSWSHAWCHAGVLDRRKSIASKLRDIERAKELTILAEPLGDVASIIEHITRIKDMGLLGGVAVDASGLGEMEDALDEIGVTQEAKLLVAAPQGGWMMSSIKGAERRLASGLLKHCGGPLMQWCVPNLKIEPTATGIRATKQSAGDAKIDPAMAMFNAVTLMSRNPAAAMTADVAAMVG
jgi:phage terminase large subunit-like protein